MFDINYKDRRPIYEQLVYNIKNAIITGIISEDQQLPSIRQLAVELAINPNTIQKAYTQLEQQGILYSVKGKGSFVAKKQECMISDASEELFQKIEPIIKSMIRLDISQQQLQAYITNLYNGGNYRD